MTKIIQIWLNCSLLWKNWLTITIEWGELSHREPYMYVVESWQKKPRRGRSGAMVQFWLILLYLLQSQSNFTLSPAKNYKQPELNIYGGLLKAKLCLTARGVWHDYDGYSYYISPPEETRDYTAARSTCKAMDADLSILSGNATQLWLSNKILKGSSDTNDRKM